jgi:hypothetical protein
MIGNMLTHRLFLVVFILLCVSTPAQSHDASQQENTLLQSAAAQQSLYALQPGGKRRGLR